MPIVCLATLQALLSVTTTTGTIMAQVNAKNTYLHAILSLNKILYMKLPNYFKEFISLPSDLAEIKQQGENIVLHLWQPLYGSKQGAHKFYKYLVGIVKSIGYMVSNHDPSVYYWLSTNGTFTVIASATDDMTMISDSNKTSNKLQDEFGKDLEIVKLGPIHWLLGMSVTRDLEKRTISLSQEAYIDTIVNCLGLNNAQPATTPIETNVDLTIGLPHISSTLLTPTEKTHYREGIGSVMYALMTHPNIAFAIGILSQHLKCPTTTHIEALRYVMCYLKGTKEFTLTLGGDSDEFIAFTDSDYTSHSHHRSISGYACYLGSSSTILWMSKKQPLVMLSSTEAKYIAITQASKKVIWLCHLFTKIPFLFPIFNTPTLLYRDNQDAIWLAQNAIYHV